MFFAKKMTIMLFFVQADHTSPSLPLFSRLLPYRKPTETDYLEGEDFFLQNTTNIAVAVRGTLCGPQDGNAINLYLLSLVRPNFSWTENVHLDIGQI